MAAKMEKPVPPPSSSYHLFLKENGKDPNNKWQDLTEAQKRVRIMFSINQTSFIFILRLLDNREKKST